MSEYETLVVEAMEARGGGFVKALANCFRHADRINFNKLRTTFREYWTDYAKLVGVDQ